MHDELAAAIAAARAGAQVVRERAGSMGPVRFKSTTTDLVTEADIASGVAVVHELLRHDPSARIVVEEDEVYGLVGVKRADPAGPEAWVIDPIDGTTSFVHGFPAFSVSVALLRDGRPVAGAVCDVPRDTTMSGALGLGATLDGSPVACSTAARLDQALLVTGFPYDRGEPLELQLAILREFLRAPVHGIRRDGSAALDCCHVAAGRADGFWEYGLQPWDTAAGAIICSEAGARVTDINGREWSPAADSGIIVANPAIHAAMLALIRETTATRSADQ
jgi:myo-inositol-1(or 4)-monophosphatase